jgi:hypothetical protein
VEKREDQPSLIFPGKMTNSSFSRRPLGGTIGTQKKVQVAALGEPPSHPQGMLDAARWISLVPVEHGSHGSLTCPSRKRIEETDVALVVIDPDLASRRRNDFEFLARHAEILEDLEELSSSLDLRIDRRRQIELK